MGLPEVSIAKIFKPLGQLVMAFPFFFVVLHIAFNPFGIGNHPLTVLVILVLLVPICVLIGNRLYQIGIEAELNLKDATPVGLRKRLEPILSERPPELETTEVPEEMSRINIDPKDIAPPQPKKEKESK